MIAKKKEKFYGFLHTVAQNPAGKILLYRLLIELHRPSTEEEVVLDREPLKILEVELGNKWSYDKASCTLKIGQPYTLNLTHGNIIKKPKKDSVDIDFFHELLHWFHSLIDIKHYSEYINGAEFQRKLKAYFHSEFTEVEPYIWIFADWGGCSVFTSYVERGSTIKSKETEEDINGLMKEKVFVMEELLTVMGMNNINISNSHGEELSENLYRALGGYALRERYCEDTTLKGNTEWGKIQRAQIIHNLQQTLHALNLPQELIESLLHALGGKE